MSIKINISNYRVNQYEVNRIFINRWSPRAMSGEAITDEELFSLFEAARWAPSSFNNQPWRFIYAKRDTDYWEKFYDLLRKGNKIWAKNAAVLVVLISKTTFDYNGKFSASHSLDAGAAWQNLALQGSNKGLVIHGMQGFDYDEAKKELNVPDDYKVEMMIAIGKPGNIKDLPENLQHNEVPSGRKKINEISNEGVFNF
ncbi:MAG: nitroreductase [Candidatus Dadabacteria bacterium]|nr:nitroreductase [Candidatus Dadabacteria bacterium]NIQ16627.1 nitroreductase [Candidatus Dadabacteria bacterium]